MNIVTNELIRPIDVDGTLIVHDDSTSDTILVPDPINPGFALEVGINEAMIRLVKEEYARGGYILVWSRGGYQWAVNVIESLGLTNYVHQVMSKPMVYFDDQPVETWMKDRVFIGHNVNYKNKLVKVDNGQV